LKRLFLDANVLFTAAHNPAGKAAFVIELGQAGFWRVATSAYAAEEARRNLTRKFPEGLPRLEAMLAAIALMPDAPHLPCPAELVEKDRPIFRAAKACGADVLLTGDLRDFGFLMNAPEKTGGLLVQTVADFLRGTDA
jgi:predicted nucleic acid-binding protein